MVGSGDPLEHGPGKPYKRDPKPPVGGKTFWCPMQEKKLKGGRSKELMVYNNTLAETG